MLLHYTVLDSTHGQRKTLPPAAAIPTIRVCLNGRIKTHVRRPQTETAACAESDARRPKVLEEHAGSAHSYPWGVYSPARAAQKRRDRGHRGDVRFRAHRIARNRSGTMHAAEEHQDLEDVRGQAGQASGGCAPREEFARNVTLLRRSAAAFAQADDLVAHARTPAAALRGLFRRRAGNHGSGKSRSVRSRWQICWPVDRASTRAIRKSLYQPGAQLQFQILFHAQTVVRANR